MAKINTHRPGSPKLIDISQTLRTGIPVWPGDTAYESKTIWHIDEQCPVNVSWLHCSTHTGTHADAPYHYDQAGKMMDQVALDAYIGPCQVIDLSLQEIDSRSISLAHCQALIDTQSSAIERVLFKTYQHFPSDKWDEDFVSISHELIDWLANKGCILVGLDSPSLDPQNAKNLAAHNAIKHHKMAILEGLVFDQVNAGHYELIALPLKLASLDASPVRAILRTSTL
ncbi:Putative cyclase [Marinomonas sp. MED121]|uniref:arylformamidase n=1 Tax=Marinomonas sp. MED121 TaxID=314277 RepID=UPI0000691235|nr:arylformamidase [Marinomonas sp. MED121]EAQ67407.1 Putative cyclase [Marinomonas sp. MED121]